MRGGGFRKNLAKLMRRGGFRRALANYLDAIGIFDGVHAYKGPEFAQIDLTNNCNNNCIGCWCNSPLLGEKKIDPAVKRQTIPHKRVIKLIDELRRSGTTHIYYAGGGEPFMHPEIMDILRHTKKRGLTCYVNTNFTLLDAQRIRLLAELGVDHLTVSVWAGSPKTYALTHPGQSEETFLRIKDMLMLLNRLKNTSPVIKLYHVVFNMNYQDIHAMVDLAVETRCETVEFTVIDTIPGKTDTLLLNEQERQSLLARLNTIKEWYGREGKNTVQLLGLEQFMRRVSNCDAKTAEYDSDIIGTTPCYAGWGFVRILADGNVNSCLKSHRFPTGNILAQDFRSVWNGSLQKHFREKTRRFDPCDPFFSLIGNDPNASMGCYKSCDNIGHNMNMHGKLTSLSQLEKNILRGIAGIARTAWRDKRI